MSPATADTLSWVLLYAGLLLAGYGLFVHDRHVWLGVALVVAGVGVAAGATALVVRLARRRAPPPPGAPPRSPEPHKDSRP